jgi:transcriptional regulator NrdR family protein
MKCENCISNSGICNSRRTHVDGWEDRINGDTTLARYAIVVRERYCKTCNNEYITYELTEDTLRELVS